MCETVGVVSGSLAAHGIAARAMDAHNRMIPTTDGRLLTPLEVAERLRVTAEQVRCLIRTSQLAAVNIGTGPKRPLYRITPDALAEFLARRGQSAPPPRLRVAPRLPPVPDCFPDLR